MISTCSLWKKPVVNASGMNRLSGAVSRLQNQAMRC